MTEKKWLAQYENRLVGKKVVLFGATGGIGRELARYILMLGATLLTVDRNQSKAQQLTAELKNNFPDSCIMNLFADLSDFASVQKLVEELKGMDVDVLVHNAGAYSIPRKITDLGSDNVFQINFVSPYYITNALLPSLSKRNGRVVAVGSIAHTYSKTDPNDIDFSTRKQASLVYGNAKRYLMYSILSLSRENNNVGFAVAHPGITFTNITNHYPKLIFAIIKYPMKVIFMKPRVAALSILMGMFEETKPYSWIGPRLFNIWGMPVRKVLSTASNEEIERIYKSARKIIDRCKEIGGFSE